ncbi:glycosyltransferase [Winogradskyella alexanderae]|uniref:Exostosin GT47 domain-containing protein n=1 Tax=Winogradskyella alexanderae TaxID=2877123 RepID=A0ABS7XPP9_9FLAO|nr:hypothetical protein [Winogradskyella alexanderae]MCA0131987.1 hypothetical protein [Winogradskyella alexanderae]
MKVRQLLLKLKSSLKGFYLIAIYGRKVSSEAKCFLIELPQNKFNRYLYPLIYMIVEQGYIPILNLSFSEIAHLTHDPYQKLIIHNQLLYLKHRRNNIIKHITLDPNYFCAIKNTSLRTSILPISMHPLIYGEHDKETGISQGENKSILFAGTTEGQGHSKNQIFEGVIPRFKIIEFIKTLKNIREVKNKKEYDVFEPAQSESEFVIFERHNFNLTQDQLFKEYRRHSFFLALPGRGMPLCHNLVEAMFCGSIPILQDVYSKMMPVTLGHGLNCFVYKNEEDLKAISSLIQNLSLSEIAKMKSKVLDYYESNLSSKAVVEKLLNRKKTKFYLQAEGYSIKLFQQLRKDEAKDNI